MQRPREDTASIPAAAAAPASPSASASASGRSSGAGGAGNSPGAGTAGRAGGAGKSPGEGASGINNAFYDGLGERWYEAYDDPVALLRAEGRLKNPWVMEKIARRFPGCSCRVLDLGCGAGFLTNSLTLAGHRAEGADLSLGSLKVARGRDATGRTAWRAADAYRLPWRDGTFDAVTALDFLEHVERPGEVIAEASRVLRPGGLFFFHTFNRNLLSWLVVIKGLEWFVRNTPARMHVLPLFIKPKELEAYCRRAGLEPAEWAGMRPEPERRAFWKMLLTGRVPEDFAFRFTGSLAISYLGMAVKREL